MYFDLDEAVKIANQAVFTKFCRKLSDIEIIVLKGAWERYAYDQIAARHQYATSYISQDVAPKLWNLLTEALGEKVRKSNFKEALQRNWDNTFNSPSYLQIPESITPKNIQENHTHKAAKPATCLRQSQQNLAVPELYVERLAIEFLCYETLLQPGSLIRIKAPKLMGKTSLMERVLGKVAKENYRTASLSLEMADRQTHLTNLNKFLRWFCLNLSRELKLPNQLDQYWDEEGMGAKVSCTTYLEEYLLPANESPLVIYLDDVDALFPYPEVYEDFFGLLRSWYEKARSRPNWKKLRIAIAHATDVYIRLNINQSPFNVGLPIELPELTRDQAQEFAGQYGLVGDELLIESLMQLVGGHPYLLQQAFSHLKTYPHITLEQLLAEAVTDAGIYRHHLREYWLSLQHEPKLMAAFEKVVTSTKPVRLETISAYQLQSMGLVKLVGNEVEPRCQLYRSYFSDVIRNSIKLNN
ncbi:AAA-like domain-containing protein [Nostoc sp. FACHB-87]|uniref:AAA-like domain-containing protein n=1 Tax=Nostocales TaxID=1161 RepID=UPI001681CA0A|nr:MULTISPECIES: AAA-like domain-containing protein [Nostocales]MBD2302041.1 AAA-like domain-containing protein [Nostoc sp. FACHB-190]MBD2454701.1 AAA-like domain-containing protein [Nostoc sp. FACHB-87]MBD2475880.1 AAA-like domain-containing protein [Anabaena sp. FACHB-83]MBD2490789.1 AAA-like domain-containing protein [Aulosira sp. FACHB-615]